MFSLFFCTTCTGYRLGCSQNASLQSPRSLQAGLKCYVGMCGRFGGVWSSSDLGHRGRACLSSSFRPELRHSCGPERCSELGESSCLSPQPGPPRLRPPRQLYMLVGSWHRPLTSSSRALMTSLHRLRDYRWPEWAPKVGETPSQRPPANPDTHSPRLRVKVFIAAGEEVGIQV